MTSGYDGTAGFAGSDTSEERARREAADGTLSIRLREVYAAVRRRGHHGATSSEMEDVLRLHHGQVSSALTYLHKNGMIVRTAHRRDGSKVYKHPEFVEAHDTLEQYKPNRNAAAERAAEAEERVAHLETVIADARLSLLTGEGSTAVLRILDEKGKS